MKTITLTNRFPVDPETGCWTWNGTVSSEGYAICQIDGERKYVHRLAYQLFVGPIHHWAEIDHLCRNRRCVNPAHLEAITSRENSLRGNHPLFTAHREHRCTKGHPLTPENTHKRKDGRLRCKICFNAYQQKRRQAKCVVSP